LLSNETIVCDLEFLWIWASFLWLRAPPGPDVQTCVVTLFPALTSGCCAFPGRSSVITIFLSSPTCSHYTKTQWLCLIKCIVHVLLDHFLLLLFL